MDPKPPIDPDRIDDAALALLFLGVCGTERQSGLARTWKSFDWEVMDRLHQKGLIHDPASKAKSVGFTVEGLKRAEALFYTLFARADAPGSEA